LTLLLKIKRLEMFSLDWLVGFGLIFARLFSLTWFAPILGQRIVPWYAKFFISLLLSMAVTPIVVNNVEGTVWSPTEPLSGLTSKLFDEIITGSLMGFGVLIIFTSSIVIGSTLGQLSGIQFDTFQNSMGRQPPTTRIVSLVATTGFILAGGIELMVTSILDSFNTLPIGASIPKELSTELLTTLLQQSFELAVRAVAPSLAALILSTLLVGFMVRLVPHLNLLQIGFSTNIAILWIALLFTLGGSTWILIESMEETPQLINHTLSETHTGEWNE
ncbi:MAG: flagellar biosynthetic protein FliR, partial [Planctomycetota bacterium]